MKNEFHYKDEDYEKAFTEMKRNLYKNENNSQQLENKLFKKDDDINIISKKNTELCQLNSKLQDKIANLTKKLGICEKENKIKFEDNLKLKKNYERLMSEVR